MPYELATFDCYHHQGKHGDDCDDNGRYKPEPKSRTAHAEASLEVSTGLRRPEFACELRKRLVNSELVQPNALEWAKMRRHDDTRALL